MYLRVVWNHIIALSLLALSLFPMPSLNAWGWGETTNIFQYEGITWTEVYFDVVGMYGTAAMPNYIGTEDAKDNVVTLYGEVGKYPYVLETHFEPLTGKLGSLAEFVKLCQEASSNHIVTPIDAKPLGATYGADLTPKQSGEALFWRCLYVKNRFIFMITADPDAKRRLKFFESVFVH